MRESGQCFRLRYRRRALRKGHHLQKQFTCQNRMNPMCFRPNSHSFATQGLVSLRLRQRLYVPSTFLVRQDVFEIGGRLQFSPKFLERGHGHDEIHVGRKQFFRANDCDVASPRVGRSWKVDGRPPVPFVLGDQSESIVAVIPVYQGGLNSDRK